MTVRAFQEITWLRFSQEQTIRLEGEMEKSTKQYILNVSEEKFIQYYVERFTFEPLFIDLNSENKPEPRKSFQEIYDPIFNERRQVEQYVFTIQYHFTGAPVLFKVQPSTHVLNMTADIDVNDNDTVSFNFPFQGTDPSKFKQAKDTSYERAFSNLGNINEDAVKWNNGLANRIRSRFWALKKKYQDENAFFAAINIPVNPGTASVFTAPTVKKIVVPPAVSSTTKTPSEPTMSKEAYDDMLKIIYDVGKNMERKPSLYHGKNEEGIRDVFLLFLETRFDSTTATGETFNRSGKTDMLLKYAPDGTNLFVAECKFWHGAAEFHEAISQLFDRYLTWRDSKTALLIFVRNQDFTEVLKTIKEEAKKHPYFIRENGQRGESSFSYIFRLKQDKDKHVFFEIIAFHYDK